MAEDHAGDVPSPIDLREMGVAREWAATALAKKPARVQFFEAFVRELMAVRAKPLRVLELGSGPGFLAECILTAIPDSKYTMLDFSAAMHELAHERLGQLADNVRMVVADFSHDGWSAGLGRFDAVVTMQAVHEVRHKRHYVALHRAVRPLLRENGRYLVCDHYVGADGMSNTALYATVAEQCAALEAAGFVDVTNVSETGGLVLHRAAGGRTLRV